ncbi:MAG TPA: hypothetical protein VMZ05_05400 [Spirochaetota bacterium]|nr:hypothetical protein [Spirochaetota bacterium]
MEILRIVRNVVSYDTLQMTTITGETDVSSDRCKGRQMMLLALLKQRYF